MKKRQHIPLISHIYQVTVSGGALSSVPNELRLHTINKFHPETMREPSGGWKPEPEVKHSLICPLKLFLFLQVAVHIFQNSAFRNPFVPAAKWKTPRHKATGTQTNGHVIVVIVGFQICLDQKKQKNKQNQQLTFCSSRCNE